MKVIKADGSLQEYRPQKIERVILKVLKNNVSESSLFDTLDDNILDDDTEPIKVSYQDEAKRLTKEVDSYVKFYYKDKERLHVSNLQEVVDQVLMENYPEAAYASVEYRNLEKSTKEDMEYLDYMDAYTNSQENASSISNTDSNANVTIKNVANMEGEVYKKRNRKLQRRRMRRQLRKMYPETNLADLYEIDLESHIIYVHDEASSPALKNYCEAVSLYPLALYGTNCLDGTGNTAPKHLQSFAGQIVNLAFLLSAQCKGAVAFGEFFNFLDYYCAKDFGENYHEKEELFADSEYCVKRETFGQKIEQIFQYIVHGWNQPAGNRCFQSPFTNISYYDSGYWHSLFDNFYFPDGTQPKWERVSYLQKKFMKWFNKERTKTMLTFPVETMTLLTDGNEYVDKEYAEFTAEMWAEGHSFFCYQSNTPNALASCCFTGDEIIKVYNKDKNPYYISIADYVESYKVECDDNGQKIENKEYIESFNLEGDYEKAKITGILKKKYTGELYKIYYSETEYIEVTYDHLIMVKDIESGEIKQIPASGLMMNKEQYMLCCQNKEFKKIFKIEKNTVKDKTVYDIELSKNHFFATNNIITHNCRLRNELTTNQFSFTGGLVGVKTGSCNVITMNIARITQNFFKDREMWSNTPSKTRFDYIQKHRQEFVEYFSEIIERIHKYHFAYKTMLYDIEEKGMLTASTAGFIEMDKLFSTVGFNGFNEAARFIGLEVSYNKDYQYFANLITETTSALNKKNGSNKFKLNSEYVPAEGLGSKNYMWDKNDGYWVPEDKNLYNSYFFDAHDVNTSVLDRFKMHGDEFTQYLDGGVGAHINLDNHLSKEQYLKLMKMNIDLGVSYWTFNIPNSRCCDCGKIFKTPQTTCPNCGSEKIDLYTRIIGYLKAIKYFDRYRQEEASHRVYSKVAD